MFIICWTNLDKPEGDYDRYGISYKFNNMRDPAKVNCATARNAMSYANGLEVAARHLGTNIYMSKTEDFIKELNKELGQ